MVEQVDTRDLKSLGVKSVPVRFRLPAPTQKREAFASLFCVMVKEIGIEPILMQVSSGHLLPPVQTLVATPIFVPQGQKCKAMTVTGTVIVFATVTKEDHKDTVTG